MSDSPESNLRVGDEDASQSDSDEGDADVGPDSDAVVADDSTDTTTDAPTPTPVTDADRDAADTDASHDDSLMTTDTLDSSSSSDSDADTSADAGVTSDADADETTTAATGPVSMARKAPWAVVGFAALTYGAMGWVLWVAYLHGLHHFGDVGWTVIVFLALIPVAVVAGLQYSKDLFAEVLDAAESARDNTESDDGHK